MDADGPRDTRLRAREIFLEALDYAEAREREAFLATACGADPVLRRRVESMLREHSLEDGFMAKSATGQPVVAEPPSAIGTTIGRYRLLKEIGEGGMGVVYLAEQAEPVRRKVALKIIKPGMDTRQVVARFEAERQALALMDHPNIAKVLDGGTTGGSDRRPVTSNQRAVTSNQKSVSSDQLSADGGRRTTRQPPITDDSSLITDDCSLLTGSGRPYFVMELVEGVPITEFCAKHQLTIEQRLRLFISVCQAVQHAHQKGIIHRDLKPSNVLVTVQDGVPVPKVIDFGVAKAINQRLTEKTLFTQHATLIGTPAYMSPEQVEQSGLDVDTRSDIYSLGVMLYELLTGTQPFPEQRLRSVAYVEMQRIILHEEPELPSTRVSRATTAAPGGAKLRPSQAGRMSETGMGGTGDSPVPSGDSPLGSLTRVRRPASHATERPFPISSGPWPDGTGRWPVLPRRLPTKAWIAQLRGDLDWIVLKCLEKDRNRRYETANGLAADLQRFLNDEPVVARPPTAVYRLQKAVRRNRLAFAAAAAVTFSLLTGLGATSWQAIRARQERSNAKQQAARAETAARIASEERARAERRLHATVQLLSETFTNVMPALRMTIGATKPREDLALAASQIAEELLQDAEPGPEMRRALGELYLQLALVQGYYTGSTTGEYDQGLESAQKAIRYFEPSAGEVLDQERMDRLAWAELAAGLASHGLLRWDEALAHFENLRCWGMRLAHSTNQVWASRGQEEGHWAMGLSGETVLRRGQPGAALSNYFRPLLEQVAKRDPQDSRGEELKAEELREIHDDIARCLRRLGQKEQAETWFRQALTRSVQLAEARPSNAAWGCFLAESKARLGEVLLAQAQPEEALPLLDGAREAVASLQKRDPANPGFVQLEVEVLRCQASGYAGWAEAASASPAERAQRLERAQEYLDRADHVIATVKSAAMQRFLRHMLADTVAELQRVKMRYAASVRAGSVGRAADAAPRWRTGTGRAARSLRNCS